MRQRHTVRFLPALAALALAALPMTAHAQKPLAVVPAAPANGPVLTPAQQARFKARQDKFNADLVALRSDKSLTPAQQQARLKAMAQTLDKDMLAILTPAQRGQVMKQRQQVKAQLIQQSQRNAAFQKSHQATFTQGRELAARLSKSLTPAQKSQIGVIRQQLMAQARQLQSNTALSPQAKQQQWIADQQAADVKQQAVLTPAQKADYLKMEALHRQLAGEATKAR